MRFKRVTGASAVLAALLMAFPGMLLAAGQAIVKQQNLSEMVAEADRVYRGTVISVNSGNLEINGRELPTTTFRIAIKEHFKGDVDEQKGDKMIAILQVAGSNKKYLRTEGDMAMLQVLPAPPQLKKGSDYLFLTNAPNAHGLSNTIGLAQGYFSISNIGGGEMAANSLDNLGLFRDMGAGLPPKGAVAYRELADMIRSEINSAGGQ